MTDANALTGRAIADRYAEKVNAFVELAELMPPRLRERPHFLGSWSVRDVLAHLTYWDANNVWILESEACGHEYTLDEGDVDARNVFAVSSHRDMSWDELVREVRLRRDYRAMLLLRPSHIDFSGAGDHWDEHREEIENALRTAQSVRGENTLTPGEISKRYADRSGSVVEIASALPIDRRTDTGVCGTWSLKDLMGHLAYWDSVTIASLSNEISGTEAIADSRTDDEINAGEAFRRLDRSWDEVMDEVNRNRNRRILLHLMPVSTDMTDVGEHWLEHGAQIDAWAADHIGGE